MDFAAIAITSSPSLLFPTKAYAIQYIYRKVAASRNGIESGRVISLTKMGDEMHCTYSKGGSKRACQGQFHDDGQDYRDPSQQHRAGCSSVVMVDLKRRK